MESTFIEYALSQGLWAAIAVFLFLYLIKSTEKRDLRQEEREAQYVKQINNLSQNFIAMQKDIEDVRDFLLSSSQENSDGEKN